MKKILLGFIGLVVCSLLSGGNSVHAIYPPLSVPNNRVGVHILDPNEIFSAAKLVNSSGGDWGYVTLPIRSDDRDIAKWTEFFQNCRKLHIIPIIRLTTYVDRTNWESPTVYDLVDFANFLDQMPWPTNNRYIIVFNEPNHANEWGGQINPAEYAKLLVNAKSIFSARSPDFFILSAGLDMSVPTSKTSLEAFQFYRRMTQAVPRWIDSVDGLSVHSYPNPGFSAPVNSRSRFGLKSYDYERTYLLSLNLTRVQSLPFFVTETGRKNQYPFYTPAFTSVWTEPNIVAITPFLLFAASPDFASFSLLDQNHQPKDVYKEIESLPKIVGSPLLNPNQSVLSPRQNTTASVQVDPQKTPLINKVINLFKRTFAKEHLATLKVRDVQITIEIADTESALAHGLSDRPSLPSDRGMLFIFPTVEPHSFWMKDMHFPLDMIWINNNQIVAITDRIPPPAETGGVPQIVSPGVPTDKVLEVNAGFAKQHNIQIGDTIVLQQ